MKRRSPPSGPTSPPWPPPPSPWPSSSAGSTGAPETRAEHRVTVHKTVGAHRSCPLEWPRSSATSAGSTTSPQGLKGGPVAHCHTPKIKVEEKPLTVTLQKIKVEEKTHPISSDPLAEEDVAPAGPRPESPLPLGIDTSSASPWGGCSFLRGRAQSLTRPSPLPVAKRATSPSVVAMQRIFFWAGCVRLSLFDIALDSPVLSGSREEDQREMERKIQAHLGRPRALEEYLTLHSKTRLVAASFGRSKRVGQCDIQVQQGGCEKTVEETKNKCQVKNW